MSIVISTIDEIVHDKKGWRKTAKHFTRKSSCRSKPDVLYALFFPSPFFHNSFLLFHDTVVVGPVVLLFAFHGCLPLYALALLA